MRPDLTIPNQNPVLDFMSALYFAAVIPDNGQDLVIGSELVASKVRVTQSNLDDAGLGEFANIRTDDARQTLRNQGGIADFALIDGRPMPEGPSRARQVIEIFAPQRRIGGYMLSDNAEPDFLKFIRGLANGLISIALPIKRGTELCLKVFEPVAPGKEA